MFWHSLSAKSLLRLTVKGLLLINQVIVGKKWDFYSIHSCTALETAVKDTLVMTSTGIEENLHFPIRTHLPRKKTQKNEKWDFFGRLEKFRLCSSKIPIHTVFVHG